MDILYFNKLLIEHISSFEKLKDNEIFFINFRKTIEACKESIKNNNKIFFAGNGGSSADAQHASAELVVRFLKNRKPINAMALGTNTAIATATSNDFGYDYIFSREFEAVGNKGDVVIAISTSGNSQSIINLLIKAKEIGARTIGLTGEDGGKMKDFCDITLFCPSKNVPTIQEMHGFLLHTLCKSIEEEVFN